MKEGNKMKKVTFIIVIILFISSLALISGCGSNSDSPTTGASTSPADSALNTVNIFFDSYNEQDALKAFSVIDDSLKDEFANVNDLQQFMDELKPEITVESLAVAEESESRIIIDYSMTIKTFEYGDEYSEQVSGQFFLNNNNNEWFIYDITEDY